MYFILGKNLDDACFRSVTVATLIFHSVTVATLNVRGSDPY